MTIVSTSVCVKHTPEQMYALVNDVASYPRYLPLCSQVKLLSQTATNLKATITLSKGKIKLSFTTLNSMKAGERIDLNLIDGPFKYLRGFWRFTPDSKGGCETTFQLDFEFSNALMGLALGGFFKEVTESLVESFCKQADLLYG